jgi:hypothetical protein
VLLLIRHGIDHRRNGRTSSDAWLWFRHLVVTPIASAHAGSSSPVAYIRIFFFIDSQIFSATALDNLVGFCLPRQYPMSGGAR